jgi:hypothetical protein
LDLIIAGPLAAALAGAGAGGPTGGPGASGRLGHPEEHAAEYEEGISGIVMGVARNEEDAIIEGVPSPQRQDLQALSWCLVSSITIQPFRERLFYCNLWRGAN